MYRSKYVDASLQLSTYHQVHDFQTTKSAQKSSFRLVSPTKYTLANNSTSEKIVLDYPDCNSSERTTYQPIFNPNNGLPTTDTKSQTINRRRQPFDTFTQYSPRNSHSLTITILRLPSTNPSSSDRSPKTTPTTAPTTTAPPPHPPSRTPHKHLHLPPPHLPYPPNPPPLPSDLLPPNPPSPHHQLPNPRRTTARLCRREYFRSALSVSVGPRPVREVR